MLVKISWFDIWNHSLIPADVGWDQQKYTRLRFLAMGHRYGPFYGGREVTRTFGSTMLLERQRSKRSNAKWRYKSMSKGGKVRRH